MQEESAGSCDWLLSPGEDLRPRRSSGDAMRPTMQRVGSSGEPRLPQTSSTSLKAEESSAAS